MMRPSLLVCALFITGAAPPLKHWDRITALIDRKQYALAERLIVALPANALDEEQRLKRDSLLARVYVAQKRHADAEPLLVRLIDKDPALADRHLYELAKARYDKGDYAGALSAAKGVDVEGLYAASAEVIRIGSMHTLQQNEDAKAACDAHSEPFVQQSSDLLLACGRVYLAQNKRETGALMLRYVVRHHGTKQDALDAKTVLTTIEPDYKSQHMVGDMAFNMGERWLKRRRLDAAEAQYKVALANAHDPEARAEALFRLADIAERHQTFPVALAGYERAASAAPRTDVSAMALFSAGNLATRMKNLSLAQKLFQQLLLDHPLSDGRGAALFGLGFAAYMGHEYEVSRQFFSTLLTIELKRVEKQRARYWYGRSLEALNQGELAQVVYSEVLRDDPVGYYAQRADERLNANNLQALDLPFEAKNEPSSAAGKLKALVSRAIALAQRAFRGEGLRLLERLARGSIPSHDDAVALRDGFLALGETLKADIVLTLWRYDHLSELSPDERLDTMRSRHPRHFETTVQEEARRMNMKVNDVFAVIRQESRFITNAKSPTGARGLMQLMPPTAKEVAHAVRVPLPNMETLYRPEVNVRFGTYYLSRLFKQFERKEFAFAAYNAGPGNLGKWIRQFGDLPLDVFCELIPFEETRDYVQRVVGYSRGYELTDRPKLGVLTRSPKKD